MENEIYQSDRYFTVFDYLVSHGQLLLRSDKRKGYKENIDIIFFDTNYVQLFTMLHGIKIRILHKSDYLGNSHIQKYLRHDGNNLFEIDSNGEKYYLAASFAIIYENNLSFNESSLKAANKGLEVKILR